MKRLVCSLFLIVVVTITLLVKLQGIAFAESDSYPPEFFRWEVRWDDPEGDDWKIRWEAMAGISTTVYSSVRYAEIPTSTVVDILSEEVVEKTFSSSPWTINGFDIAYTEGIPFVGMERYSTNCRPGPEVTITRWSTWVEGVVRNTSQQTVYVNSGWGWQELFPQQSYRVTPSLLGEILVSTARSSDQVDMCLHVWWNWLKLLPAPRIDRIEPSMARHNQWVTIWGEGFLPLGIQASEAMVFCVQPEGAKVIATWHNAIWSDKSIGFRISEYLYTPQRCDVKVFVGIKLSNALPLSVAESNFLPLITAQ